MGYERYPRNTNPQGDYYGRDPGSGRNADQSRSRDHEVNGNSGWTDRDQQRREYGQRGQQRRSGYPGDQGRYASDGRRFEDAGRNRFADDDDSQRRQQVGYGRQPQGYDYEDRGFMARAGDELRSWFGDDEANSRREMDARYDGRGDDARGDNARHRSAHDDHYRDWREAQMAALDRDYDEYRQENRSRFDSEFGSWRTQRQTQRGWLGSVQEHMEVIGSDGAHVGTVDKVRGDRILLTKNDQDAGGHHHSIPSRWLDKVDDKVMISKSADEAKSHWRDEERNQAVFGDGNKRDDEQGGAGRMLNRSYSGTY